MGPPLIYDLTRLASRFLNATPNGIDRVDLAFARHCLGQAGAAPMGAFFLGPLGYRFVGQAGGLALVAAIEAHLGETRPDAGAVAMSAIKRWLRHGRDKGTLGAQHVTARRAPFAAAAAGLALRNLGVARATARTAIPPGARYLNVSQYPLARPRALDWLGARPDMRAAFFVHDLLPLERPELFPDGEAGRHRRRLGVVARLAAGAIVSTSLVKAALQSRVHALGRRDMPIFVAALPIAPAFVSAGVADAELSTHGYFLQCGTLEPRKNHAMILEVWRELAARRGAGAPKLILVGARGWKNAEAAAALERCPALADHVLVVEGLATPGLARLMRNARALLMPSLAEGYGLPLAEAVALGTPAIASDIAAFAEAAGGPYVALGPHDRDAWARAIETAPPRDVRAELPARASAAPLRGVDEFLASL